MSEPSYATLDQFGQWTDFPYNLNDNKVEGTSETNAYYVERALAQASRDLDSYLGWPAPKDAGLRTDVEKQLSDYQTEMLARAAVAQAVYRLRVGEPLMVDPTSRHFRDGSNVAVLPRPARYAPGALEALQDAGIYRRSGTVPPDESDSE